MEKEQIKKIVREATDKHLYVVNGITVEAFEKTLIEALLQALSMSGVVESVCDACNGFGGRSAKLGMGHLRCPKCGK